MQPLKDLLASHEREYEKVERSAKMKIEKLHVMDSEIKQTAMNYFKAAQQAEECVAKYQRIKYDAD